MVGLGGLLHDLGQRAGPAGETTPGVGIRLPERLQVRFAHRPVAESRQAEQLLGGDPGQVDVGVGVNEAGGPGGAVGHEPAVGGQGLGEPAVSEVEVAQEVGRLVTHGAAKHLGDDLLESGLVALGQPPAVQGLRLGVHPLAVGHEGLGWQRGDPRLAVPAGIHVEEGLARGLGGPVGGGHQRDGLAVLLDDPQIQVDRLGPLLSLHLVGGVAQEGLGGVTGVGMERGTDARRHAPQSSREHPDLSPGRAGHRTDHPRGQQDETWSENDPARLSSEPAAAKETGFAEHRAPSRREDRGRGVATSSRGIKLSTGHRPARIRFHPNAPVKPRFRPPHTI